MKEKLITLCILSFLVSCDSMMDDKAKASQYNQELLLFRTGGGNAVPHYMVSGRILNGGAGIAGVTVTITGGSGASIATVTDSEGKYVAGLASPGNYTVTPAGGAYRITPSSRSLSVVSRVDDVNFLAGSPLWRQSYGTLLEEKARAACATSDGCYLIAGYGYSRQSGSFSRDGRIIKIDCGGNVVWDRYFGGTGEEAIYSIIETTSHDYAAAGYSTSRGNGGKDAWILRIDQDGRQIEGWDQVLGGAGDDRANSLIQSSHGEFIIAGVTETASCNEDAYVVGISAAGALLFEKAYGGNVNDAGNAVIEAGPGAYLVAGHGSTAGSGDFDSWAFMIDGSGSIVSGGGNSTEWSFYFGKTGEDSFKTAIKDRDGGFVLGGYWTDQLNAKKQVRVVRIYSNGLVAWDNDSLSEKGDIEEVNGICAGGGGFLAVGKISSNMFFGNPRIIKLSRAGDMLAWKTFVNPDDGEAFSVIPGYDGTYLITGYMKDYDSQSIDFWSVNCDANFNYGPN